jgi:hypothetical protein
MNDLSFVERAVSLLASKGVDTWVFGGWGEELRGLIKPPAPPHSPATGTRTASTPATSRETRCLTP